VLSVRGGILKSQGVTIQNGLAPVPTAVGGIWVTGARVTVIESGYPLQTIKPLPGSPVIDTYFASITNCQLFCDCPPYIDERGDKRFQTSYGKSEFGSIEFNRAP
jgi:hypothetical protein